MMVENLKQPHYKYLILIGAMGVCLNLLGLAEFSSINRPEVFWLILILASFAEIFSVSLPDKGINFEVGTAIALASISFASPATATLLAFSTSFAAWIINPANKATWRKTWAQLFFNGGMHSVAIFLAAYSWLGANYLLADLPILSQIAPWIIAAIVYDQANFALLMVIIRLQQGKQFQPFHVWRENLWAMPINIFVAALGAGLLTFVTLRYDWVGVLIFYLPIVTSGYAFRLYINKVQAHMDTLEAIIAERTHELAEVNREKDAFLAVLTHDMKSPLTTIGLYASMIKEHPRIIMDRPKLPDVLLRSQKSLLAIVENILDLETIQSGGEMQLDRNYVDITALANMSVEELRVQADSKGVDLTFAGTEFLSAWADSSMIKRVITNLISNAIKYTPPDGSVKVSTLRHEDKILLQVQDSGYGIPEADLPLIFERYHRVADHVEKARGTGLGLAVTKALVAANEGQIRVESEVGVGSLFTLELPLQVPRQEYEELLQALAEPAGIR